ncbi:sugar phosphate isomerase/epimerase family protein [Gemmata sp. JC717]|uniref:sugar phosphate isomerase/epimerase family protein n=1 Tax=Gemmata algarum TaxID=2975278 RepID=UPI0021BB6A2F|nr:sugar phosphate isomerase/epimerase family protein [Gemmata algarum]MDY3553159.1 sugar phosphate isomerase/epimerase family protein [Gemmata algarum]
MRSFSRRDFLAASAAATGAALLPRFAAAAEPADLFKISLAQWSLHRAFRAKGGDKLDPLKFAEISTKQYGITAIEYVNQFYADKKKDGAYLTDLKKVADDNKVTSVLIMCDGEGNLGNPDEKGRVQAVENHKRWAEWAKFLGCHSIRVNAASDWKKGFAETQKLAADGLRKLAEFTDTLGINTIVENHGGLSSHGEWLAGVMKLVDHKRCGTLPDFGNFNIGKIEGVKETAYDRYKGVDELMPFAKGVSAKSHDFDDKGNETHTDYRKMLEIVLKKHKYSGFVGIEYEGGKLSEADGIKATKKLLETVRAELAKG